jgi:hypothetical protein
MQNGYRVPTALAGKAPRPASPLANSNARITLRIRISLVAIYASLVPFEFHFIAHSVRAISSTQSRTPIPPQRSNVNFLRQARAQCFEKCL